MGRTRLITLGLFITTALAALALAQARRLGLAQTLITVLVGGGAPAALYLGWATYRDSHARDYMLSLEQVANQLAIAIRNQWEAEASVRRLNDPYPLPICWVAADASLVDSWNALERLVLTGAGWGPPTGVWADGPDALAGGGNELVEVLWRVPTRRLVVLGEPGAGKTMLMVRLVLDLLARRRDGEPVPVLASVASWDPSSQNLHEWLASSLTVDHPDLAAPAPGHTVTTRISALLREGIIMPILDGLDEIPEDIRGPAISKINDALRPAERIVLTSRTEEYRDGVHPPDGAGITLRGAAGVELRPLDLADVADYLRADAADVADAARWKPVISSLDTMSPVASALSTPLMVSLARMTYSPRPGEYIGDLPDPAELCAIDSAEAIKNHLYDGFIRAAYRPSRPRPERHAWTARRAESWLTFLATYLQNTANTPDLAWWQFIRATPPLLHRMVAGLVTGLTVGYLVGRITAKGRGLEGWLGGGLWLGLVAAACVASLIVVDRPPLRGQTFQIRTGLPAALATGLGFAIVLTLARLSVPGNTLIPSLGIALAAGLTLAVVAGFLNSAEEMMSDLRSAASPGLVLAADRRTAIMAGLSAIVAAGLGLTLQYNLNVVVHEGSGPITPQLPVWTWFALPPVILLAIGFLARLIFRFDVGTKWGRTTEHIVRRVIVSSIFLLTAYMCGLTIRFIADRINPGLLYGWPFGGLLGALGGGIAGALLSLEVTIGLGIICGVVISFVSGVTAMPRDLKAAVGLAIGHARGPENAISRGLWVAIALTLAAGIAAGWNASIDPGVVWNASGAFGNAFGAAIGTGLPFGFGLWVGLQLIRARPAWPLWLVTRVWLASRGHIPWRIMAFLADAHRRGVLRQEGAVYQFRHIELQQRLAGKIKSRAD